MVPVRDRRARVTGLPAGVVVLAGVDDHEHRCTMFSLRFNISD